MIINYVKKKTLTFKRQWDTVKKKYDKKQDELRQNREWIEKNKRGNAF